MARTPNRPTAAPKSVEAAPAKAAKTQRLARPTVKATARKTVSAGKGAAPESPVKQERVKLIRDSFTMPKPDFELIGSLKQRALALGREVKKSELLRAGLHALSAQSDGAFTSAVSAVPRLKTGRPHHK